MNLLPVLLPKEGTGLPSPRPSPDGRGWTLTSQDPSRKATERGILSLKRQEERSSKQWERGVLGSSAWLGSGGFPSSPTFLSCSVLVRHSILPFGEYIDLFDLEY